MSIRQPDRRPRPYSIERRDQLVALASAVRQEVIDTLQAAGPRSAAEVARLMGRPPDALYYHLRKLLAVGLVVVRENRRRGRRMETVYDLVGRPLSLRYPDPSEAHGHPLPRLVRAMTRTAERDFQTALGNGSPRPTGRSRNLWAGRRHAWLTATDLHRMNVLIDALTGLMTRSRDPGRGELCTLTLVLAPRDSRSGRRSRRHSTSRPAGRP